MARYVIGCFAVLVIVVAASPASAQHEGHQVPGQTGASGADPAQLAACVEAQRQTSALVEAATLRLEAARQTNQPSALRSAIEDLQTTLSTIRTQLATCTQLQAAASSGMPGMPPGHNMANMPGAPTASSSPTAPAGAPVASPSSPQTAPAAPGAPTSVGGAAANEHAGHTAAGPPAPASRAGANRTAPGASAGRGAQTAPAPKMVMVMTATDPAKLRCETKIDPKTAAKATYKGKTYYFCSARERDEFLTDPEMSLSMRPPLQ